VQQQQQQQGGFRGLGTGGTYGNRPLQQGQDLSSGYGAGAYGGYPMGVNGAAMSHYGPPTGMNPYGLTGPTGPPHAGVATTGEIDGTNSYGSTGAAVSHGTTSNTATMAPSATTGQYNDQTAQPTPTPPNHNVQAIQGQYPGPPGIYGQHPAYPYYYNHQNSFYYPPNQVRSGTNNDDHI